MQNAWLQLNANWKLKYSKRITCASVSPLWKEDAERRWARSVGKSGRDAGVERRTRSGAFRSDLCALSRELSCQNTSAECYHRSLSNVRQCIRVCAANKVLFDVLHAVVPKLAQLHRATAQRCYLLQERLLQARTDVHTHIHDIHWVCDTCTGRTRLPDAVQAVSAQYVYIRMSKYWCLIDVVVCRLGTAAR